MGKSQGLCPVGKRHTYIITPIIEMATVALKSKPEVRSTSVFLDVYLQKRAHWKLHWK